QLARAIEEGVPDRLRRNSSVEQLDNLVAGVAVRALTQGREQVGRGRRIGLTVLPALLDLRRQLEVALPGAVSGIVALRRVAAPLVVQQGIRERAEDRLGVLPADAVQRAPAVGHVDRLVADRAKIAGTVAEEELVDLVGAGRAGETGD